MAHDDIEGQHRVRRNVPFTAFESLLQSEKGHLADVLYRDLEDTVLAFTRKSDLELHLYAKKKRRLDNVLREDNCSYKE